MEFADALVWERQEERGGGGGGGKAMSANFSVKVGRHNDFISPSQACVVSLNSLKKSSPQAFDDDGSVQIQSKKLLNPDFNQASALSKSDPVKVSLHDCLACSGCITSAETVLIEQQSTGLLLLHQTPFSVLGFVWFLVSNHH